MNAATKNMPREMLDACGNAAKNKGRQRAAMPREMLAARLHNATRYVGKNVFGETCALLTVNLRASYFNDIYTLSTQNK